MIEFTWRPGTRYASTAMFSHDDLLHLADVEEKAEVSRYVHSQGHMDCLTRRIYELRLKVQTLPAGTIRVKLADEIQRLTDEQENLRK